MKDDTEIAHEGSVKEYLVGFFLSVLLTVIPFALVTMQTLPVLYLMLIIGGCAVGQLMVQAIFFLHLDLSDKYIWNTISFGFIVITVLILTIGSLWLMGHLNHNMLLGH
jgi:cytochrome o ubiquinol oxidase subunit IV